MSLFRREVVEASQDRLHGEVVFTQGLSSKLLVLALFAIVTIAAVWLTIGNYARVETVPGILVTDVPSAKVVAPQPGIVTKLGVKEGEVVEKGDRLMIVTSDRETEAGGNVAGRNIGALEARQKLNQAQVAMASSRAANERQRLSSIVASSQSQAASLTQQIALQREVVASNQKIFD